jgi:hypothetical protein
LDRYHPTLGGTVWHLFAIPWSLTTTTTISMPSSVTSLDSVSSQDLNDELRMAQKEWEESLEQLQQLVSIVLLPFFGKWLGRRWSYWGKRQNLMLQSMVVMNDILAYARYLRLGLGKAFFFGGSLSVEN